MEADEREWFKLILIILLSLATLLAANHAFPPEAYIGEPIAHSQE